MVIRWLQQLQISHPLYRHLITRTSSCSATMVEPGYSAISQPRQTESTRSPVRGHPHPDPCRRREAPAHRASGPGPGHSPGFAGRKLRRLPSQTFRRLPVSTGLPVLNGNHSVGSPLRPRPAGVWRQGAAGTVGGGAFRRTRPPPGSRPGGRIEAAAAVREPEPPARRL